MEIASWLVISCSSRSNSIRHSRLFRCNKKSNGFWND